MKRTLLYILALVSLAACGPSRHAVHVEMRHPSKSGLELADKNISVVYLENGNSLSDALVSGIADGFAYALEKDYGSSIGIYSMRVVPGGDYASRDTLVNLIMDTGVDVTFLIDTLALGTLSVNGTTSVAAPSSPDSAYVTTGNLPFRLKVNCYDAMSKVDKVYAFGGSTVAVPFAYSDGRQPEAVIRDRITASLPEVGFEAGETMATSFKSQWKHEQYSIIYFDSDRWYKALVLAEQYEWKAAMEIWMQLAETNDPFKRACAAYNIAVACHMLGDKELAAEWLDRADADNRLPLSETLRKRI